MASGGTSSAGRLVGASLVDDLNFLLARANALSLASSNAALAAHDLKARSYSVLSLAVDDLRPTQRELAAYLRLDPSQVVALVDDLQRRGLIERQPDPSDRRVNVVRATEAGRALHAEAVGVARAAEAELHSALDEDERRQLAGLLRRIAFVD